MRVALIMLALLVLGTSSPAQAQWERGTSLLTINLGYAGAESQFTGNALNGGTLGVAIEHVVSDNDWSFGALFTYIVAEDVSESTNVAVDRRIHASPIFLTSRFWFGSPKIKGSGGLGFGWHTSSVESTINGDYSKQTSTGIALTVLLGVDWFVGEKVFINANVQPIFMAHALVANDAAYLANLGVGFRI